MLWAVAHYDADDWTVDFVGTEDSARAYLSEVHAYYSDRIFHLFCEVEAVSDRLNPVRDTIPLDHPED